MRTNRVDAEKERNAEKLLNDLRTFQSISLDNVRTKYNCSYHDITEYLNLIKSWGYKITNSQNILTFISAPDKLIDSEIAYALPTKFIGNRIKAYQTVSSTNDTATKFAEQGAEEGMVVVSELQTKGKGRFNRNWYSTEQKGIYCSILLRPTFKPEHAPALSLMTAVALADTFQEFSNTEVQIKWPNDILLNQKKTAGILTELSADKNKINHVIVGVGINLNHIRDDFPLELQQIATSLAIENNFAINRVEFLQTFLTYFESAYIDYKIDRLKSMHDKLLSYSSLLNSHVELSNGHEVISGKVIDINQDGALVLNRNGETKIINSGEITVLKK